MKMLLQQHKFLRKTLLGFFSCSKAIIINREIFTSQNLKFTQKFSLQNEHVTILAVISITKKGKEVGISFLY